MNKISTFFDKENGKFFRNYGKKKTLGGIHTEYNLCFNCNNILTIRSVRTRIIYFSLNRLTERITNRLYIKEFKEWTSHDDQKAK